MSNWLVALSIIAVVVLKLLIVLRRAGEFSGEYRLTWKGWCVRFGMVGAGVAMVWAADRYFAGHVWYTFAGIAFIVLPLFLKQIPYEIQTRLFKGRRRTNFCTEREAQEVQFAGRLNTYSNIATARRHRMSVPHFLPRGRLTARRCSDIVSISATKGLHL